MRTHSGSWIAHNNFEDTRHNGHGNGNGNAYAYGHNHHSNHDHNRVYCVTGTYNGSGSISVTDGAIVRLCGTGNIPTISLHKGVVKVLSGASVTVTNFNIDNVAGNELIIYQGGSLTVTNWFNPHHTVVNHGNLNLAALHLVNGFDYPEEETDISEAYNYFSVWAQSGGASYETWYDDLPGYIDGSDLYSGQ